MACQALDATSQLMRHAILQSFPGCVLQGLFISPLIFDASCCIKNNPSTKGYLIYLGTIAHVGLLAKSLSIKGVFDFQSAYAVAAPDMPKLEVTASIARALAA